jgi:tetratricopeptide (TPR) repeat protein
MTVSDGSFRPYVGLRAFRVEENGIFYGRARESLETARIWRAKRLTLLYGASGVGKTSLLQAGVIPALDPARFDLCPVGRIRPALPDPAATVPVRNPFTFALLLSWAPDAPSGSLADETISGYLRKRGEKADRYGDPMPMLVAIDQAEELFSSPPQLRSSIRPFIGELADALREHPGMRLLLSLREDYLAAVLPFEQLLAGQSRTRSRLLPFGRAAALEAIRGPLTGTGRSFDPEAAEELVSDLQTVKVTDMRGEETTVVVDSIEPVQVQIVCAELWDSLPDDAAVITSAQVREHADVDRFLASFCSRALYAVAQEHGIAAAKIRSWLQQTFVTEYGTRGTAYQGIDQTAGMPNAVVWALEDRHILKAEHRSSTRWYELQHDRLIEPIRQADSAEHLEAAKVAQAEQDWDVVERHAIQAIRVFAPNGLRMRAEAEHLLGEVGRNRGQPDTALDHYRTAAGFFEVLQDSAAVGASLAAAGRLSLSRGRHAAAAADLQAAIARIPADLGVQTDLAQALWHGGQQRVAVTILNTVVAQDSNLTEALRARGEILADLGEADRALRDLDRVRHHQQPSTQAARALALALAGRIDAAGQEAADALANGEDNATVLLRTARVQALAGRREEAVQLATAALAVSDTPLPPHLREHAQRLLDEPQEIRGEPGTGQSVPM